MMESHYLTVVLAGVTGREDPEIRGEQVSSLLMTTYKLLSSGQNLTFQKVECQDEFDVKRNITFIESDQVI